MPQPIKLYLSQHHPCSYLPDEDASDLFIDPKAPMDSHQYSQLAQQGFRRSGDHIYRPHCPSCQACKAVRLPVAEFQASRQQRRTWRKNQDLTVMATTTPCRDEHNRLFERYVTTRHPGGGMDQAQGNAPFQFFQSAWSDTLFFEFRQAEKLLAVAVCDPLTDGLSAVYSYFDPRASQRSLGVMAILWQIEQARKRHLPYLYLGYWIESCQKMRYKNHYQPLQWFTGSQWRPLMPATSTHPERVS